MNKRGKILRKQFVFIDKVRDAAAEGYLWFTRCPRLMGRRTKVTQWVKKKKKVCGVGREKSCGVSGGTGGEGMGLSLTKPMVCVYEILKQMKDYERV